MTVFPKMKTLIVTALFRDNISAQLFSEAIELTDFKKKNRHKIHIHKI